jgi:hypothetical protein
MTDWTKEEDEAFNDVEKHSNLGKQIIQARGQPYHWQIEAALSAVRMEREECARMVDHILKEGGGTWGDAIRARVQE